MQDENVTVVKTDVGAKNGQNKCPKCGATEISLNVSTGKLRCNFCRHEFEPEKIEGLEENISNLSGQIIGSGAQDIIADTSDIVTFKCSSCGASVVVDTASAPHARCHWCRNTLSVNEQIPNGSIPDAILPFKLKKEEAENLIQSFVGKRKFYAHPKFRKEFKTDNIMGVYFPYMVVDVNAQANLYGKGEHLTRKYTRGTDNNATTYYDADVYFVERKFDIAITGLTVESNTSRLDQSKDDNTNNVINSIMPFDTENCVKYDSNYLKGYTSEKRDINIDTLKPLVSEEAKDIARFKANETLMQYDRGVAWSDQKFDIKGEQWKSAYLPVWLYSYQQVEGDKKILHYVAVNARTKETMGSVPIYMPKLFAISFILEIFGVVAMLTVDSDYSWIFLSIGFLYFALIYGKYRNKDARHTYELETKSEMSNLYSADKFVQHVSGLTNSEIRGMNNKCVNGVRINKNIFNKILEDGEASQIIK